jgi:O-antigen ligase
VPIPFGTATLAMRAGLLRTGGTMLDYSAAGVLFASVLCIMPMLKPRFRPLGFWGCTAVLAGGLLATQSRGAWIATILGFLFVLAFRRKWGQAVLLMVIGIAGEMVLLLFAKSGILASIVGNTADTAGTVSYRRTLAARGFDQVWSHPMGGQRPDQLVENLADLMQGQHIVDFVNSHLYIAMAAGLPLFFVWCCIWLAPVVEAWRHPARGTVDNDLVEVPAAMIVPVMIAITATSLIDRNLDWPIIAIALAGPCFALARPRGDVTRDLRPLASSFVHVSRPSTALI